MCVARTGGYVTRPRTAADAQAFAATMNFFLGTPVPDCQLDLPTIALKTIGDFFRRFKEILKGLPSSAAAVGFSAGR